MNQPLQRSWFLCCEKNEVLNLIQEQKPSAKSPHFSAKCHSLYDNCNMIIVMHAFSCKWPDCSIVTLKHAF